jgi:RNA polymerase sigma factor (sigma-70 family)
VAPDLGPSDADLVARVLARDDRHAFATLVRRHQGAVRGFLRRLVRGDHALADDLAQETFLRAYRALSTYRGGGRLSSWLFAIAYRTFLTDARAAAGSARRAEAEAPPPVTADGVLDRHALVHALGALSTDERAAVALTWGEEMTHEEAAEILGCPLGTLKTRVLSARTKLRAHLLADEVP